MHSSRGCSLKLPVDIRSNASLFNQGPSYSDSTAIALPRLNSTIQKRKLLSSILMDKHCLYAKTHHTCNIADHRFLSNQMKVQPRNNSRDDPPCSSGGLKDNDSQARMAPFGAESTMAASDNRKILHIMHALTSSISKQSMLYWT